MLKFAGKHLLLDIEGTTSSISFVHEVMFPYAAEHVEEFLRGNWESEQVSESIVLLFEDYRKRDTATDISQSGGVPSSVEQWLPGSDGSKIEFVSQHVLDLISSDTKSVGLKDLQGKIWKQGFESGQLKAHLYPEVAESLKKWKQAGWDLRIYSSGSKSAQLLFFGHTMAGSLLELFTAHYDMTIGNKKSAASYQAICDDIGAKSDSVIFISDVWDELEAASEIGCKTVASIRPGNAPLPANNEHPTIMSFEDLDLSIE